MMAIKKEIEKTNKKEKDANGEVVAAKHLNRKMKNDSKGTR